MSARQGTGRAPVPAKRQGRAPGGAANRVRIIGGEWRSRVITFPDATGLRPTPDRVRETLFNWLGQTLDGLACLDLFAGSGALSFEALSRGARSVVAVEYDRRAAAALRANVSLLKAERLEIIEGDALAFLDRCEQRYDVVFLDPPFNCDWLPKLWAKLACCIAADGLVYVEAEQAFDPGTGWEVIRHGRAGGVHYHLVKRNDGA